MWNKERRRRVDAGENMSFQERLQKVLENLPAERLPEVVRFVEFLVWREEQSAWQEFGKRQLAKAYGANEPEYSEADLKAEPQS